MKTLTQHILENAANFRCGLVLPYQEIKNTFADIGEVYNISVPEDSASAWKTASGCCNFDRNAAICGALGESLERYSAATMDFPAKQMAQLSGKSVILPGEFSLFSDEQYGRPDFPWPRPDSQRVFFSPVHSLYDNREYWILQELVGLGTRQDKPCVPSTSTGTAAHSDKYRALLLGLQELLERDALTSYWLNSLGGRQIELPREFTEPVLARGGQVQAFDITQAWNPHPVVVVCGHLPANGIKRISLGAACRQSYRTATAKAYTEWIQGCIFAGYYQQTQPEWRVKSAAELSDFDRHAVYYTYNPGEWEKVPLLKNTTPRKEAVASGSEDGPQPPAVDILEALLKKLKQSGIRLFYRDITMPDVREAGLTVVKVISPELALLHGDEKTPFLGGRCGDAAWRYPDLVVPRNGFPNPYPHPLG